MGLWVGVSGTCRNWVVGFHFFSEVGNKITDLGVKLFGIYESGVEPAESGGCFIFKVLFIFIYLKGWQKKRAPSTGSCPQNPGTALVGPRWSQEPEIPSESPTRGCRDSNSWAIFLLLPGVCISRSWIRSEGGTWCQALCEGMWYFTICATMSAPETLVKHLFNSWCKKWVEELTAVTN